MSAWVLPVAALYGVLDERRQRVGLSWRRLAGELDLSPSTFTRMKSGLAPDAHTLGVLLIWLGWAPELAHLVQESAPGGGS